MTMSTPHALPPVTLSREMDSVYDRLARQVYNQTQPLLFSICGGTADTQIASDACVISPETISAQDGFTVFTTGMVGAWTGAEHQTIVWCHQIRWRVARALLEMTKSSSRQEKLASAKEWFLGHKSLNSIRTNSPIQLPVTAQHMTLRVSDPKYDTGSAVIWCRDASNCQRVDSTVTILPAPKNPEAPFPLPGEGVRPDEIITVIDVKLPEASGYIEVQTDRGSVVSGTYAQVTAEGNQWRTLGGYLTTAWQLMSRWGRRTDRGITHFASLPACFKVLTLGLQVPN